MTVPRFIGPTALAVAVLAPSDLQGQAGEPSPIEIGTQWVVHSDILGENRPILVGLPEGYDDSDEPYPVVYLLDGQSHFHHTTGSVHFLAGNDRMPAAIVVGVGNVSGEQRTRDLTPALAGQAGRERFPTAGGAEAFLRFLVEELRPWVDARFRTRDYDVLVGHSFGGLFITDVLQRAPGSFDAYLSISPSLWWDEEGYVAGIADLFDRHPDARGALYMTMGNEGGEMLSGAWAFAGILEKHAPKDFRWKWNHMPAETHGTVPHRSTYDGLEWIFDGWDPMPLIMPVLQDDAPVVPALDALEAHYASLTERMGWEVRPNPALGSDLGGYLVDEGRVDEGVAVLERVVSWYAEDPRSHGELALALMAACRLEEARRHFEHARSLAEAAGDDGFMAQAEEGLAGLDAAEAEGTPCTVEETTGAASPVHSAGQRPAEPTWEPQFQDSTALFIGLSVVDEDVVWASGNGGRVARTLDGGENWTVIRVPGEEETQFRDVHAVSADEAWVLSIPTPLSRIYRTTDGGRNWTRGYGADTEEIFLDCFAFWDSGSGFVFGDSRNGEFVVLRSDDGAAWSPVDPSAVPDAREGEGGFAASGTCAVSRPGGLGWFATGASGVDTRVIRTTDFGATWHEAATPIASPSSSAGIFSLAFVDDRRGAAFGGDLSTPDAPGQDVAWTDDGGATWTLVGSTGLRGAVYGAAAVPGARTPTLIAVGPDGSAWSADGGRTWTRIDDRNAWTVAFHAPGVGWAAGQGHISRFRHRE